MFYVNKDELLRTIHILRREKCVYDPYGYSRDQHIKEPHFCDCKYGYDGSQSFGTEQSGCPELRSVEQLLRNITDIEYKEIMGRNNEN